MTSAQWTMLEALAAADYGELFIRGRGRRTYETLASNGYVEPHLPEGWGKITAEGRERVRWGRSMRRSMPAPVLGEQRVQGS